MKPAHILIVEDKLLIAENIAQALLEAGYTLAGQISSGEEALPLLEKETPDVIIMDIHLAGKLDGIQTVEQINRKHTIPVIYLTDYHDEETRNRAKHTRPAAYLLKPFNKMELLIAIELAFFNTSEGREATPESKEPVTDTIFSMNDRIFVKKNDILQRVDIDDILWIKADRSYYEIKTPKHKYTLVGNLNQFMKKYSHPLLFRVHRSYIVNLDKITGIRGNMLIIGDAGGEEIPTSDTYRSELNRHLNML